MTKRRVPSSARLNSIPNSPWPTGASPKRLGQTTTIRPTTTGSSRRMWLIQKAVDLSGNASPSEQAYIMAMAKRFPADPKADRRQAAEAYHDAMREVSKKYPDDLDAATLFAESGMNLHPWGLWHPDGTPEAGTDEIVATLESVIRRDPNHLGAVHYYIHTVEASPSPERALAAANRLAALAPAAGHIVHMPAHIYIRTGDYAAAVKTNEEAAAVD